MISADVPAYTETDVQKISHTDALTLSADELTLDVNGFDPLYVGIASRRDRVNGKIRSAVSVAFAYFGELKQMPDGTRQRYLRLEKQMSSGCETTL